MAQPSGNKQQHKITDYRKSFCEGLLRSESEFENFMLSVKPTQYVLTYCAKLKPQSKAKVCYSVGISLNNPKN